MDFRVIQGDIAQQSADALVNAAGTSLRMGSGVAGALRREAGDELNEAAMAKGPVQLGDVAVTDAFELDAEYITHAAALPHYGSGQATEESIRAAVQNTLDVAKELDLSTIVLPALGCGVAGFDLVEGAKIIAEEITAHEPVSLDEVRLIAYSDEEYETMVDAVSQFRSEDR